jgi:hypothetical protein
MNFDTYGINSRLTIVTEYFIFFRESSCLCGSPREIVCPLRGQSRHLTGVKLKKQSQSFDFAQDRFAGGLNWRNILFER